MGLDVVLQELFGLEFAFVLVKVLGRFAFFQSNAVVAIDIFNDTHPTSGVSSIASNDVGFVGK